LATSDANHLAVRIDVSVTRGAEKVSVRGTFLVVLSPFALTVNLSITVNDVAFARITGTATATSTNIQRHHAHGSAVSAAEDQALYDLFILPLDMEVVVEHLFNPSQHLMGGRAGAALRGEAAGR